MFHHPETNSDIRGPHDYFLLVKASACNTKGRSFLFFRVWASLGDGDVQHEKNYNQNLLSYDGRI